MPKPMTNESPKIKLLLVGIGGYGNAYFESFAEQSKADLVAVVDPMPELAPGWPELEAKNIPAYPSVSEFLNSETQVDLAIIASPISFHAEQSCTLLGAGINVLCEKPIAATMEDVIRMQQARDASDGFLEIGYQWCYSQAIQSLKHDILSGTFGAAQTLLTRVEWPRSSAYYSRNNWAGSIQNKQGQTVNDSPVGNATAHYLNNMLYILGEEVHLSTRPKTITAECYRANPIENYDTACCRIQTEANADILFYTTHAVQENDGPVFKYLFEQAEITYENGGDIIAHFEDGTEKNYGNPDADRMLKLTYCIEKCLHPKSTQSICSAESASAVTQCVEALQKVTVTTIPDGQLMNQQLSAEENLIYIPGIESVIKTAYDKQKLFSELNAPWAQASSTVPVEAGLPDIV